LEDLATKIREQNQVAIEPMQLAGLLLEKTMDQVGNAEAETILRPTTAKR
jgi:hypothetical protein